MKITVPSESGAGDRLDRFLAGAVSGYSRAALQRMIHGGHVSLNGHPAKAKTTLREGDVIVLSPPEPEPPEAVPQDLPLRILYEDEALLVLDKAHGMVVHPAAGNPDGTLVNALLHHCGGLSAVGGVQRPGIVHRLDKDTSGCMVVAKNDRAHQSLSGQFSERKVEKTYLAAVEGRPVRDSGEIRNRIGRDPRNRLRMAVVPESRGKPAATNFRCLASRMGTTLVLCELLTGRTHQIRVHMKMLGHPILGDEIYARPSRQPSHNRLMLHAWRLAFTHPETGERMAFEAPLPPEFEAWGDAAVGGWG